MVSVQSRLLLSVLFVFTTLTAAATARADILFEGYSKVLLDKVHVGYAVQRYEFDAKKHEYTTAYFLKTNAAGGNITESLSARSTAALKPISYQFTELVDNKPRTIDATFNQKTDVMTAIVFENGKKTTVTQKIPKGGFLSSFLAYVLLQGKEGMKTGVKYAYQAVAEETASVNSGEAYIDKEEPILGLTAFKVANKFKGAEFESWVTFKGEVVATSSPKQKVSTELVATVAEATAGQSFSAATLTKLFGSVPKGLENPVARKATSSKTETTTTEAPPSKEKTVFAPEPTPDEDVSAKKQGVPGGKGIILKGQPTKSK